MTFWCCPGVGHLYAVYWTASIVEWNISESFCLCILLVSLFFEKEWILICCPLLQSKIGLHKTPQAAQALASHANVKGILRGSSSHSSSIPPESPLGRLRGRLPKLSPYKWFQKRISSTEKKNISCVMQCCRKICYTVICQGIGISRFCSEKAKKLLRNMPKSCSKVAQNWKSCSKIFLSCSNMF